MCDADLLASDEREFGLVLLPQSLGEEYGLLKLVIIPNGLALFRLAFFLNDVLVGVLGTGVVVSGVEQLVDVLLEEVRAGSDHLGGLQDISLGVEDTSSELIDALQRGVGDRAIQVGVGGATHAHGGGIEGNCVEDGLETAGVVEPHLTDVDRMIHLLGEPPSLLVATVNGSLFEIGLFLGKSFGMTRDDLLIVALGHLGILVVVLGFSFSSHSPRHTAR